MFTTIILAYLPSLFCYPAYFVDQNGTILPCKLKFQQLDIKSLDYWYTVKLTKVIPCYPLLPAPFSLRLYCKSSCCIRTGRWPPTYTTPKQPDKLYSSCWWFGQRAAVKVLGKQLWKLSRSCHSRWWPWSCSLCAMTCMCGRQWFKLMDRVRSHSRKWSWWLDGL